MVAHFKANIPPIYGCIDQSGETFVNSALTCDGWSRRQCVEFKGDDSKWQDVCSLYTKIFF